MNATLAAGYFSEALEGEGPAGGRGKMFNFTMQRVEPVSPFLPRPSTPRKKNWPPVNGTGEWAEW